MSQAVKSAWPIPRGIQTLKELLIERAERAAADGALDKVWSDTFDDATGIDAGNSSGYSHDSGNKQVDLDTSPPAAHAAMTAASSPSPLVATQDSGATHPAWKIFDYDGSSNYWQASGAYPHWAKIDLGSAKTITTYKHTGYQSGVYASDWILEGSNNDSDWTTIDTVSGHNTHVETEFTVDTPGSYRYYRWTVSAGTGTSEVLSRALKLYEAAPSEAVLQSVQCLDLASAVTEVMVFATVSNGGSISLIEVSTDNGSTWDTIPSLETIAAVTSGTQIKIRLTFTGSLDFWAVAV